MMFNLWTEEFDDSPTPNTDEMIVMGTIQPLFISPSSITDVHAANEIMFEKDFHGPIDGSTRDVDISFSESDIDLFSFTMFY